MDEQALRNADAGMSLLRSGLFKGLSDYSLTTLHLSASRRLLTKADNLFHQGDAPERLHMVASGTVKLWQVNSQGNQHTLGLMRKGAILGCAAVVNGFPYPATATAEEDSEILSWSAASFHAMMETHPDLTTAMLHLISDRAREFVFRLGDSTAKSAEQRVAAVLVRLARQNGTKCASGVEVRFTATLQDLSQMSGVAYFTVSRILSEWRRSGVVKNDRHRLTIQRPHSLVKIAGID